MRIILPILILLQSTYCWAAPTLTLFSPKHNQITTKDKVLVKGIAPDALMVKLNGDIIPIQDNGRFFIKADLTKPNAYHVFKVEAVGKDNEIAVESVKVYYKVAILEEEKKEEEILPARLKLFPKNHTIRKTANLQITGQTQNIPELAINERVIDLQEDGTFRTEVILEPGKNTLLITGKDNELLLLKEQRTYYYEAPKPKPKLNKPSIPEITKNEKPKNSKFVLKTFTEKDLITQSMENVEKLYIDYKWTPIDPYPDQVKALGNYAKLMRRRKSLIIVRPLENEKIDLYLKSKALAEYIKQESTHPLETISVLWLNQKFTTLELHFDNRAEDIGAPFLILLNDKEIKRTKLSPDQEKQLNKFANNPFGL